MMSVHVVCSNEECGQKLKVADEFAAKSVKCPKCGTSTLVPAAGEAAADGTRIVAKPDAPSVGDDGLGATRVPSDRARDAEPEAPTGEGSDELDRLRDKARTRSC